MNEQEIEREIRRLAPWYYLFEFGSVRTDITEPFDHWGHRQPVVPTPRADFWAGKSVLDLGCNEGGLSFSALSQGAIRCHGVECRETNVEKARFVARVQGHEKATFEVGEVNGWLAAHPGARYDVVIACGLLYHLPYPWETLGRICAAASQAAVISSVLAGGGDDGYTPFEEAESIGASAKPEELSQMPNSALTISRGVAEAGLVPTSIHENRVDDATVWGGALVVAERPAGPLREVDRRQRDSAQLSLYTITRETGKSGRSRLDVVLYNLGAFPRQLRLELRLAGEEGSPGPERMRELTLAPRPREAGDKQDCRRASFEAPLHACPLRLLVFEQAETAALAEYCFEIE